MPQRRQVVLLMIAATVVTAGTAAVGLQRAMRLWRALAARSTCPVEPPRAAPPPLSPPPSLPPPLPPRAGPSLTGVVQVRDDAVEIEAAGARHRLPGYPRPRSPDHQMPRLTTALVAPDRQHIAIAGDCHGNSGGDDRRPSCAPVFVRIYRLADGAHVRDLATPWAHAVDDEHRPLAMAFDDGGQRLAVLIRSTWSDCSWGGVSIQLLVYRLADGARLARRVLAFEDTGGVRSLTLTGDVVRVRTEGAHDRATVQVIRLRKPRVER